MIEDHDAKYESTLHKGNWECSTSAFDVIQGSSFPDVTIKPQKDPESAKECPLETVQNKRVGSRSIRLVGLLIFYTLQGEKNRTFEKFSRINLMNHFEKNFKIFLRYVFLAYSVVA